MDETPEVECTNPWVGKYLGPYCFGTLRRRKREVFEAHILFCEACWQRTDRFLEGIEHLRSLGPEELLKLLRLPPPG